MAAIPVGRRNLFAERRRAILGIAGVAVALVLVLTLDAIFAGAMRQVSRYIDTSGADLFVSQSGVRTMHMSSSAIPLDAVRRIQDLPGVRSADPILYESSTVTGPEGQTLSYVVGFRRDARAGRPPLVAGFAPGAGEIVLDSAAAQTLGASIGAEVEVLDRSWTVSGLTSGMTNIVNSVSYVRLGEFARARDLHRTASYVLVEAEDAVEASAEIASATGLTVQTRSEFSTEERQGIEEMSTDLMQIMTLASFLIGLAVIALTLYAATLSRLREIGIMKALGATPWRLGRIVISQAAWTIGAAIVAAVLLVVGLGRVVASADVTLDLVVEPASVIRIAAGAAVLGLLGASTPLVRLLRLDPTMAFRR